MCGPHLHTLDLHGSQIQVYKYTIYLNTEAPDKPILLCFFCFIKKSSLLKYRVGGCQGPGIRPYNIYFGIYLFHKKSLLCEYGVGGMRQYQRILE